MSPATLSAAWERIDRDFARPLTVSALAAAAGGTPSRFIRAFQRAYGQTPGQCLRARRLARACELLTTTGLPITEVCHQVGYRGLATFSRIFREQTGQSPRAFRRRTRRPVVIPGCFRRMYRLDR